MKSKYRRRVRLLIASGCIVGILAVSPWIIRIKHSDILESILDRFYLKGMSEDYREQCRKFWEEKLELPPDVFDVSVISPETLAISDQISTQSLDLVQSIQRKRHYQLSQRMLNNPKGTNEETSDYRYYFDKDDKTTPTSEEKDAEQGFIQSVNLLASLSDYSPNALPLYRSQWPGETWIAPNIFMLQLYSISQREIAIDEYLNGTPEDGLLRCLAILKSARILEYDEISEKLMVVHNIYHSLILAHIISEKITDPELLSKLAKDINQHQLNTDSIWSDYSLIIENLIGVIRFYQYRGYFDLTYEPMSGKDLLFIRIDLDGYIMPLDKTELSQPYTIDEITSGSNKLRSAVFDQKPRLNLIEYFKAGRLKRELYLQLTPNVEYINTKTKLTSAHEGILTTRLIDRIGTGSLPMNIWQPLPVDPFDKNRGTYRQRSGVIYSVGPDGLDQQANIRYDPTNGTISQGDIFIDPENDLHQIIRWDLD